MSDVDTKQKILITGGAGYIGSHAVLMAIDLGFSVTVIDNLSTGNSNAVPDEVVLHKEDIGNRSVIEPIIQSFMPDIVMHFAGSVSVPESVENPITYYQNNTAASINFIDICHKNKVKKFIFSSTAAVYGACQKPLVTESSPTYPMNPYGHSKRMIEQVLQQCAASYTMQCTVLRYFNVAGADPNLRAGHSAPKATHIIKVACQNILQNPATIKIFGDDYNTFDGTGVRDFIHVSDLVQAHFDALPSLNDSPFNIFNCGNGKGYSVRQVIDSVERVSGRSFNRQISPRRHGDVDRLVADATKLMNTTKWRPKYKDIDAIVESALAWERKQQSRKQ